jgi:hypothetical protein
VKVLLLGLVAVIAALLVAGGLLHRPAVADEEDDERAVVASVHDYVLTQAREYRAGLGTIDAMRLEPDYYRACVDRPGELPICLFVNTDQSPAGIKRDPAREPNEQVWR